MKKKKIILLVMLIILIIVGVSITLLYFFSDDVNELWGYSFERHNVNELPVDDGYDDNERVYGGWNSQKNEIYRDGKLKITIPYTYRVIQIYNNDKLESCHIKRNDDGNNTLECVTANYALVNNTLYVAKNETDIYGEYTVLFKDDYMILKASISSTNDDYMLLYFLKK